MLVTNLPTHSFGKGSEKGIAKHHAEFPRWALVVLRYLVPAISAQFSVRMPRRTNAPATAGGQREVALVVPEAEGIREELDRSMLGP